MTSSCTNGRLAEEVGGGVNADAVVRHLVVNVVRHARPVAAAVEATVRGDGLAPADGLRHRHAVRMAVEDHDRVTSERPVAVDLEARVATAAVSVGVRAAHDRTGERSVDCRATVTPNVPAPVCAPRPGSAVVAAAKRITATLLIGGEGGTEVGRTQSGRASATRVRCRTVVPVYICIIVVVGDAVPLALRGLVVEALARIEGAHHGASRRATRTNINLAPLGRRPADARTRRGLGHQGRDEHGNGQ
jgi:hypothetical protein